MLNRIQFPIIKGYNCDYFEITHKLNQKRNGKILTINWKNYVNAWQSFVVTMVTVYIVEQNIYWWM